MLIHYFKMVKNFSYYHCGRQSTWVRTRRERGDYYIYTKTWSDLNRLTGNFPNNLRTIKCNNEDPHHS